MIDPKNFTTVNVYLNNCMLSLSIVLKMLKQYNQIKIHNQFSHQILESF